MQGVESVDLFATKGIEYLLVIGYLAVLIAFWRLMSLPTARPQPASRRAVARRASDWFDVRDGIYFHQGHGWAAPEDDNVVTVGMDDFSQRLLGPPAAIELPPVGVRLKQGERGWSLRLDDRSIGMLSPVDGEVVAVNEALQADPALVNADPYEKGWLMKVRLPRPESVRRNLLTGGVARAWMADTVEKLRTMRSGELGVVMPDGGMPVEGFVRLIAPEDWVEVAREFLLSE